MKTMLIVILVVFSAFMGMILGIPLNDYFGGATIDFSTVLAVVFCVATASGFILSGKK